MDKETKSLITKAAHIDYLHNLFNSGIELNDMQKAAKAEVETKHAYYTVIGLLPEATKITEEELDEMEKAGFFGTKK